jgi:hypothetical protein
MEGSKTEWRKREIAVERETEKGERIIIVPNKAIRILYIS